METPPVSRHHAGLAVCLFPRRRMVGGCENRGQALPCDVWAVETPEGGAWQFRAEGLLEDKDVGLLALSASCAWCYAVSKRLSARWTSGRPWAPVLGKDCGEGCGRELPSSLPALGTL